MAMHNERINGFSVTLENGEGKCFACGAGGHYFAYKRPQAVAFKRGLKDHLSKGTNLKVVPVTVVMTDRT